MLNEKRGGSDEGFIMNKIKKKILIERELSERERMSGPFFKSADKTYMAVFYNSKDPLDKINNKKKN